MKLNEGHVVANIDLPRMQINRIMSRIGKEISSLRSKGTEIRERELQEKLEQTLQGHEGSKKREKCLRHIMRCKKERSMWRML